MKKQKNKLMPKQREEIIVLRFEKNWGLREIAEKFGVTTQNISYYLRRHKEKQQIEAELNSKLTSFYYPNACTLPMSAVTAEELTRVTSDLHGLGECHVEDGSWKVAETINKFLEDYYSA